MAALKQAAPGQALHDAASERSRRIWRAVSGAGPKGIALASLILLFENRISGAAIQGSLHLLQAAGHITFEGVSRWGKWVCTSTPPAGEQLPLWLIPDTAADLADEAAEPQPVHRAVLPAARVPNSVFALGDIAIGPDWGLHIDGRQSAPAVRPAPELPLWARAVPHGFDAAAVGLTAAAAAYTTAVAVAPVPAAPTVDVRTPAPAPAAAPVVAPAVARAVARPVASAPPAGAPRPVSAAPLQRDAVRAVAAELSAALGRNAVGAADPRFQLVLGGLLIVDLKADPSSAIVLAPPATRALFKWVDGLAGTQLSALLKASS